MSADRQILFEPFRLDQANACLWRGPEVIPLTPKVLAVLTYLVRHAGRLVTRDEVLRAVWPDTIVGEHSLTVCIREIRRVLSDQPKAPRFIETRHRHGYRFIAPVTEIDRATTEVSWPSRAGNAPAAAPAPAGSGLVGRETELLQLEGWLEKAARGERQVVFVTGEPGIGKTTLVEAFQYRLGARPDVLAACGRCFEHHGTAEAYLPVLEALSQLGRGPGGGRLVALLARHAPTWLAQLPQLRELAGAEVAPRETVGATPERMLREMVEVVVTRAARAPLVLVLEDLHWSDYATLDLVSALARRREPARLLLVATYRPVEVIVRGHALHAVKQELQTHRFCAELPLEPLTEAAVGEYLALRFQGGPLPAALARLIHQHTEGHPLFMVSVIDDFVARGVLVQQAGEWALRDEPESLEVAAPENIRLAVEQRLGRLKPEELLLLEGASVAGLEFSAAAVAAALQAEVVAVEERCERLARRRQFLRAAGVSEWPDGTVAGRYQFLHWLYQDVLYQRVTPARRRALHRRLGECLAAGHGESAAEVATDLATHFQQGGDPGRAIRYLALAADRASRRYANREALDYLRRALDLAERLPEGERLRWRMGILEQRGWLRCSTGDMVGAAEDFAAVAAADPGGDGEVKALLGLGTALFWADRPRCLATAERAAELSAHLADPVLRAFARALCSNWILQLRDWRAEDFRALAEAVEVLRRANQRAPRGVAVTLEAYHRCHRSEYRAACEAAVEGLQLTLEAGEAYYYMSCQYFHAWALLHLGAWGEALRVSRDGLRMAERNGHRLGTRVWQFMLAWLHEQAFDFQRARELCEPAVRQAEGQYDQGFGLIRLGMAHLGLEQSEPGFHCFREVVGQVERGAIVDWTWHVHLHHGLSEYWLARGRFDDARREAERTCALAAQPGERTYLALGRRTLAEIAIAKRAWEDAETHLAQALPLLQDGDVPMAEWRVYATAARLYQRWRRTAEAERWRERSLAVLQRLADSLGSEDALRQYMLGHMPAGLRRSRKR